MKKDIYLIFLVFILLSLIAFQSPALALPAFPGAEGFGSQTSGGRGGKVYFVTNLNDSGSGSLRAALEASGPRIVVFRTGGTISLNSSLNISNPYITIAGQTAPGGGITIKGGDIRISTHDVVMRYITSRRGAGGNNHAGTLYANNSNNVYNIVIDHCSFSWGVDETFSTWYRVYDFTLQNSIISEALNCSTNSKGCHSKGVMFGGPDLSESSSGDGARNISFHHSLIAHCVERNPLFEGTGRMEAVNNVIYHTTSAAGMMVGYGDTQMEINWIKNYFKKTDNYEIRHWFLDGGNDVSFYVEGNIGPHRTSDAQAENLLVYPASRAYMVGTRFSTPAITEVSATQAYTNVLAEGGAGNSKYVDCSGTWINRRDNIDQRIVNDVKNNTGSIIDDPSNVGGWISISPGTACPDTDNDGMPDTFEMKVFGSLAQTATGDLDSDGYTNIEEFINGINQGLSSNENNNPPSQPTGLRIVQQN